MIKYKTYVKCLWSLSELNKEFSDLAFIEDKDFGDTAINTEFLKY